jgi:hypothetical protein
MSGMDSLKPVFIEAYGTETLISKVIMLFIFPVLLFGIITGALSLVVLFRVRRVYEDNKRFVRPYQACHAIGASCNNIVEPTTTTTATTATTTPPDPVSSFSLYSYTK